MLLFITVENEITKSCVKFVAAASYAATVGMTIFRSTSWEKSAHSYTDSLKNRGGYYHEHLVIPGVLRLLNLRPRNSLLDIGCGEGILARNLPKDVDYLGLDASVSLISIAKKQSPQKDFLVADVTKPVDTKGKRFTHAATILALQNISDTEAVLQNVSKVLQPQGKLVIVLNHPCFRIPRLSSWGIDEARKLQYRRIDRYMTSQEIPINTNPGKGQKSPITWSFHRPLSYYFDSLQKAGFIIEQVEEWCSDKVSVGDAARMENRGRSEFPLFLAIKAQLI